MTDGDAHDEPMITRAPFTVEPPRAVELQPDLGLADPMITEVPGVDLVEGPAVSMLPMDASSDRPPGWWRLMFGRSREARGGTTDGQDPDVPEGPDLEPR